MLKKVMIICLAFSFVFIGGIGIALAGDCDGTQKGKTAGPGPHGPVGPGYGTCDFTSPDSSIIIAKQKQQQSRTDQDCDGEGPDFTSNDSSIIIAKAQEGPKSGHDTTGKGAPNSGDGVPDGSGW